MKKFLIWLLVAVALVAYLSWTIEDPVARLLVYLSVAAVAIRVAVLVLVVATVAGTAWLFLRRDQKDFYRQHRVRFTFFVMVAMGAFVVLGFWLNRYALPHRYHPLSLVVDALVAAFAVFVGWLLIAPSRRKLIMALPVTGVLALVVFIVTAIAPGGESGGGNRTDPLSTLGYLTWVPVDGDSTAAGVMYHDSTKAFPGYNIYGPRNQARAVLMDNDGNVVHAWERYIEPEDNWNHMELLPNGDLLALVRQKYLLCLDWDSNIRWVRELRSHHDVAVSDSGVVYALSRSERTVRIHGLPVPVLDDQVVILEPDGTTRDTIWMFDMVGEIVPRSRAWRIYRAMLDPAAIRWIARTHAGNEFWLDGSMANDIFHTNSIEVIDRDIDSVFRRGNLLISSRTQNTVMVVDPRTKELLWTWGPGIVQWQHHPTLLDNGNLLVFDNGSQRKWTRIIELDPGTKEIVWEYIAENRKDFFSYTRGGNQRLPNGNTLVTNSDSGHAFEVTSDGEIVWEFLSPEMHAEHDSRAAIYRLMRIYDRSAYPCLDRLQTQ